ncbi:MAG TPA: hypothetical protein LFW21_02520 [Rickettsia endosymbiont of Pyrocoelia pectoralis]|nr:hypothetical protein [Rickettsia endosymbiont of Pyrocoelia pectoralis]
MITQQENDDPILEALLKNNVQDLSSYLNNLETQVKEEHLSCALDINPPLLEILLSHHTAKVTKDIIDEAIDDENLKALQTLLNHSTAKVESCHINHALKKPETFKVLLTHPSTKIEPVVIYQAIQNEQLDALQILLNHPTAKVEGCHINQALEKPETLKVLLTHPSTEVEPCVIYQAIQNKQLDALQILLNHPTAKVEGWMITDYVKQNQELLTLFNAKLTNNSNTKEIETLVAECSITDSLEASHQDITIIGEDSAN